MAPDLQAQLQAAWAAAEAAGRVFASRELGVGVGAVVIEGLWLQALRNRSGQVQLTPEGLEELRAWLSGEGNG